MTVVKSAYEKAMEKIKEIEALTPEEREYLKDRENMRTLLSTFFKGELSRDEIWGKFRQLKGPLLKEAQLQIADSLRLGGTSAEFLQRKDGILAIEALKEKQNTAAIETSLNAIGALQREYQDLKERAAKELRAAIQENPQMRARPVRTPDGRTVLQTSLSVDEALQLRMAEFLAEHEKKYDIMFGRAFDRLKKELP